MNDTTDNQQPAEPVEPLQITPPRTYVNASTLEPYCTPIWPAVRPGGDDHKRVQSRGF
jgi:hypothetical protein